MRSRRSNAPLSLVVDAQPRNATDGDLARGLVAGHEWAIAETWHRFAPMVLMTAERSLGSRAEAEDVAQEVFSRVFRKVKTLREPEALRSFIYSFAVRVLKSELRRRKVRALMPFLQSEPAELGIRTVDVEARDLLKRLYALMDRLTPRDRLVFVLRRMESMTVEEIAVTMGLSISTVKRAMNHAASRMTTWIETDPGLASLVREGTWGR